MLRCRKPSTRTLVAVAGVMAAAVLGATVGVLIAPDDARRMRADAQSEERLATRLRAMDTPRLMAAACGFLAPADRGMLHYGIGREVLRRLRSGGDPEAVLSVASDVREPAELRGFGIELLDASCRGGDVATQQRLMNLGVEVAFHEEQAPPQVRRAALIMANRAVGALSAAGRVSGARLHDYCARLDRLMMSRDEPPMLRGLAARGLGQLSDAQRSGRSLMAVLSSPQDSACAPLARSACLALARLKVGDAVPAIGRLLATTTNERTFASAACALGDLGGGEALAHLVTNAARFDDGSCGAAIERQRQAILGILAQVESPHILAAILATAHLYREQDVAEAKSALTAALPLLPEDRQVAAALARLHVTADREECARIVELLPREEAYAEQWDQVSRKALWRRLEGVPSKLAVTRKAARADAGRGR